MAPEVRYTATANDKAKIESAFTYHPPVGGQAPRYVMLRDQAKVLAYNMTTFCPPSRELSLALTRLEEAIMWANAAIARNERVVLDASGSPAGIATQIDQSAEANGVGS